MLSTHERRRLLESSIPDAKAVREQLQDYLGRTGLEVSDFARRINYSRVALNFFMNDKYQNIAANDSAIRSAIRDFIHAHPIAVEQEFEDGKIYATENVRLLRRYFYDALDKGYAYYIYGPPGTQKTFILQHLIAELNRSEVSKNGSGRRAGYVYCRAGIRPVDLLKRIAEAFGVMSLGNADRILKNFRFDLRGRRVLIVFDEAQHLSNDCLETVRELIDRPPYCGLLFDGSHNLKQIFQQVELEQWRSRLHAGKELPGISDEEGRRIIGEELGQQSERKVAALLASARVPDPRQGKEYEYVSARKLFWALRDIRAAIEKKEATA